jgi:aryl-alcohol dehydrogenase-like predicted oxidoreductase
MPWSPLAYGLLTGKYDRATVEAAPSRAGGLPDESATGGVESGARLDGANPFGDSLFTARNWAIVDALKAVAAEIGAPPARVALAWALSRPAVDTVLVGVSRVSQLEDNIKAVALDLSPSHLAALDAASRPDLPMLYGLFSDEMRRQVVFGGAAVRARR